MVPCVSRSSELKVRFLGSISWLAPGAAVSMGQLLDRKSNSSAEDTPEERPLSGTGPWSPIKRKDSAMAGMVVDTEPNSSPPKAFAPPVASKSTNCPKKSLPGSSVLALLISSQYMLGSLLSTASALMGTVQEVISRPGKFAMKFSLPLARRCMLEPTDSSSSSSSSSRCWSTLAYAKRQENNRDIFPCLLHSSSPHETKSVVRFLGAENKEGLGSRREKRININLSTTEAKEGRLKKKKREGESRRKPWEPCPQPVSQRRNLVGEITSG